MGSFPSRRALCLILAATAAFPAEGATAGARAAGPDAAVVALVVLAALLAAALAHANRLRRRLACSEARRGHAEAEWVQALDFAQDALYMVDLHDCLVRGNRAFYEFIGIPPEQADGQRIMRLIHGELEHEPCPVCQARLDRRDAVFVKEADDPMNRAGRPLEIIVRIVRDRAGEAVGMLQMIRDLSRERAIADSEERFRRLSQAAFEGIAIHDDGVIVDANQALADMLECPLDEVIGMTGPQLVQDDSRQVISDRITAGGDAPLQVNALRRNGSVFQAEIRGKDLPYGDRTLRVVAVRDVTELHQARAALFEEKERLQVTLESISEGVITTDIAGCVQYLNPVAEKLTGWRSAEAAGHPLTEVFRLSREDGTDAGATDPVGRCLAEQRVITSARDSRLHRRDGEGHAVEHSVSPIRDREGRCMGAVLVFRDVTEVRGMAQQLAYQATHDALTDLLNRREFERRLEQALAGARAGGRHALCYLDLDQFKVVNDTCGHGAGDELLRQLSTLLRGCLRREDVLARLGGDEFGILLADCSLAEARDMAERVRETVRDFRLVWQDRSFEVSVSVGVCPIEAASPGVPELLSAADTACYVAKDRGRDRIHAYSRDDSDLVQHQNEMHWAQRVSRAVDEGRLVLYCQPIVEVSPGAGGLRRYEILVRMVDEDDRLVPPMAFIPAAERYNLMPAVDRWVIRECLQAVSRAPACTSVACAINVSGRSLCDERFQAYVLEEIHRASLPAEQVCFEITETAAIANFTQAKRFMTELRALGCTFALDDFGSGLSSFGYLKNLPVDFLKIDGSFVRDIGEDPIDLAMVESINQLGHVMGIRTIAEYVETDAILAHLRRLRVDFAQGFAIGRPRPLEEVLEALPRPSAARRG